MEYVVEKALEGDLRRQAKSWQRKVDVARMAMKREKKLLQNMLIEEKHLNHVNNNPAELVAMPSL